MAKFISENDNLSFACIPRHKISLSWWTLVKYVSLQKILHDKPVWDFFSGLPQFCTIRFSVHNGWPLAFWVLTRNINLFGYYYFLLCFVTKCHKPLTCNNPESINHRTVAVSHFIWKRNKQWRWQIMRELNVVVQNEEFSLPL